VKDYPTRITVILCTHNRARSLAAALESIVTQTLRQNVGWEILVVDNNSSDETRQVVDDFRGRYPERVRYLFEPQQGISHARNSGVRNARGDILTFIDDDETAEPEWLQNLTANLFGGEWAGAGGRILPIWTCARPSWLSDDSSLTSAPLAMFDAGSEAGELTQSPFGANMAFRREVFDLCGGFRTDLGRAGKSLLSGEDSEFGRRVMAAGRRLRYEPSALTYHPVEEYRVKREYFLQWWFNKGRSDIRESRNRSESAQLFGVPLRLIRSLIIETIRWTIELAPARRFVGKLKVWSCAGQVFECYHQSINDNRNRTDGTERNANLSPPA